MLYEQIAKNKRKTVLVMFSFFVLVMLIGAAIGYANFDSITTGIILAAVLSGFYMLLMISNSTKVVMGLNHAKEVTSREQAVVLWDTVENMAMVAQIPMPKIYIINDPSPNAFATGNSPKNSAVAATTGLLEQLNQEELEGVMAHEVSHIRNYDIRLSTIAVALAAVIALLGNIGTRMLWFGGGRRDSKSDSKDSGGATAILYLVSIVLLILAPIAATMVQMALSRNREYLADASAVELTRNPQGLISALEKISGQERPMKQANSASAALYIENPFKKENRGSLFATHPPTEKRIERLEHM